MPKRGAAARAVKRPNQPTSIAPSIGETEPPKSCPTVVLASGAIRIRTDPPQCPPRHSGLQDLLMKFPLATWLGDGPVYRNRRKSSAVRASALSAASLIRGSPLFDSIRNYRPAPT